MSANTLDLKKQLLAAMNSAADATESLTSAANVFPDFYERILELLTVIKKANKLSSDLQKLVANLDESFAESDAELQQQIQSFLRTQTWMQTNHDIAQTAIAKLSDLEDVTLQFYDNPHPDTVFDE